MGRRNLFIVPSHHYQYIKAYTDGLRLTLGNEACQGRLFKGTPKNPTTQKSRYVNQSMGKNTIGHVGIDVATYLKLDNPARYTGHCFRRTAATLAADNDATTSELQRHFGWKDAKTAQKYIDNSEKGAKKMSSRITPNEEIPGKQANIQDNVQPSTSQISSQILKEGESSCSFRWNESLPYSRCTWCHIQFLLEFIFL